MAERARNGNLALTPYHADTELCLTATSDRIAALRPPVRACADGLDEPPAAAKREALPWAIARRQLRSIGCQVAVPDDPTPPALAPTPPSPPSGAPGGSQPT